MRLKGKVALVTGAGRGIGAAVAVRLAMEGAAVAANYGRSGPEAEEVVRRIQGAGGTAFAIQADIGDVNGHSALIDTVIDRFGSLDILVNNAGIEVHERVLDATQTTWEKTMDVNLKGAYFLSSRTASKMKPGSSIVCISSVHDARPLRERAIYSMTKGGMLMMVRALALELAPFGINVNGIAPGAILTDMNRGSLEDSLRCDRLLARIPAGRIGTPDDIAGVTAFLCSPDATYMHGAMLYVDGGLLLS